MTTKLDLCRFEKKNKKKTNLRTRRCVERILLLLSTSPIHLHTEIRPMTYIYLGGGGESGGGWWGRQQKKKHSTLEDDDSQYVVVQLQLKPRRLVKEASHLYAQNSLTYTT